MGKEPLFSFVRIPVKPQNKPQKAVQKHQPKALSPGARTHPEGLLLCQRGGV
jgi:hypothetical protein